MSTAGPWSVKGIDPKAREIAKDLARRSGLTLGEWLNQMITETGDEPPPAYAEREPEPALAAASTPAPAPRGWSDPPARTPAPPPAAPAPAPAPPTASVLNAESFRSRLRDAGRSGDTAEAARITKALAELTAKVEAAEHRSTLAISGIDQQAMGVLSRLEGVERDQTAVAARFEGALDEVRDVQDRLGERMRRMEGEDGPRLEAMKALEGALGKVATQIYEGESRARAQAAELREDVAALVRRVDRVEAQPAPTIDIAPIDAALAQLAERLDEAQNRTSAAVRALESSFAGLDQRLAQAETPRSDPRVDEVDRRLERLASELNERVESTRSEMAARLRDATGGKLSHMEGALRDLSGQVADAEKRSADAIDRMGREVVRIAQGLGARMGEVDRRSQETVEQVGGEMARIADVVESRLSRADNAQAQALEKLGGEIARIAEKLSERISASERRNADDLTRGLGDVGDRLHRATEKLNGAYDRAAADLADRIRASENRTARLLEDAQARFHTLESAQPHVSQPAATFTESAHPEPHTAEEPRARAPAGDPFAAALAIAPAEPDYVDLDDPFQPGPFAASTPTAEEPEPAAHDFSPSVYDAHDPFALDPAGGFEADDEFTTISPAAAQPPPSPAAEPPRPSSTRELIEQARAAARANAEARNRRASRSRPAAAEAAHEELFSTPAPGFEEAEEQAPARGRFGLPRLRRREASTVKTALYASAVAATLSTAGLGAVWMAGEGAGRSHVSAEAPTAAPAQPALLAMAETPTETTSTPPVSTPAAPSAQPLKDELSPITPAAAASGRALFTQALHELERDTASGVDTLKRAADLGYAPAQFYLGKLYEDGSHGLKKDMAQARRWTERGARAGDLKAMFNLGLYLANGEGGPRDDKAAVEWFRRAADGGVKDAQFNLAVMNQNGRGAPANAAEAYKWFLIAAADGDGGARQGAEALKPSLSSDAQAAAERSAAAYRAQLAAGAGAMRTAAR